MALLLYICILLGTYTTWTSILLFRSYRAAQVIGLPIIVSPISVLNPLWIVLYRTTSVISILKRLPFNLGKWASYTYVGWQFDDKDAIHRELGPAFVLCTPGLNSLNLADPAAVHTVLTHRKDFTKPAIAYELLNCFGRNLDTVEGETWQRHRRLTAPNFNERVSSSVWFESVQQASQMMESWSHHGTRGTQDIVDDTAALALNVLTYAGFGIRYPFKDAQQKLELPHRLSYRDAILFVLRNFTYVFILPMSVLSLPFMPPAVRKVCEAFSEFKLYMVEMVAREKAVAASQERDSKSEASNLLSALVRASEAASHHPGEKDGSARGLEDDELYGNLFIYIVAGHETSANTAATSIAYLAAAPKWQDWVAEEISRVIPPDSKPSEWRYDDCFPKLKRCLAVQYETIRLHGSVPFLPKWTGNSPQTLTIAGKAHLIPAGTFVITNSQALHCSPETWGPDALTWRPDRWIRNTKPSDPNQQPEEYLIEPQPGTFVGWADGPRVCPGKKFSQVELVAAMAVLFQRHRVRLKREPGESEAKARRRLEDVIEDSSIDAITLQMRRPRDVRMVWEEVR